MLSILGWLAWRGLLVSMVSLAGMGVILVGDWIAARLQPDPNAAAETNGQLTVKVEGALERGLTSVGPVG